MKRICLLIAVVLLSTGAVFAQDTKGIKTANLKNADLSLMKNHDPEVERANFELLPGYEVNLFASEPMIANPVHMMWDSRGRLWVACSWAYPQIKPGEKANDKIIILEDTDGDGKADKSTVFADGLYLPTGIELANGGCYVAQSPDVFFFKDTDGDDVADVKEVALTGFGIEDSHHSISAWRRGPGGWIYFQEGIFLNTQVETQYGVVRNFNGGVYQYNPRTQELRMFVRGTGGNPWGHVFDRWGQSFMVNNPRIMYLSSASGNSGKSVSAKSIASTEKQCGGDIATGSHVGDDIRGQLLTGRFKSRTVVRYEFIEDGAGFSANVHKPLISAKHPNFRPVDVKIGPDGAVYVADWYNSIINHAQHDFRDPRRDHDHGRIWRITAKNRPLVKKPSLHEASIDDLVDYLKSPEDWIRHQARNELTLRDHDKVVKAMNEWVEKLNPQDTNHDHHLVEAMWACQNIGRPNEAILKQVMAAKDGNARAAGARIIRYWHSQLSDPVTLIAQAADDPFPRARMESVLSAGFIPKAEAFAAALRATDRERDGFIDSALAQTTDALKPYWQPALAEGKLDFSKPEHQAFIERRSGIGFDDRLAKFLRQRRPTPAEIAEVKGLLVASGNAKQARAVLAALVRGRRRPTPPVAVAMLDALNQIGHGAEFTLGKQVTSLQQYLSDKNDTIAARAAANLGTWKASKAGPSLTSVLKDEKRSLNVRLAAAIALGDLGDAGSLRDLKNLASKGDLTLRYFATHGLVTADVEAAASAAVNLLGEAPGETDPVALVAAFVQRENGAGHLAKLLSKATLHSDVVTRVADYHRRTGQLPSSVADHFLSQSNSSLASFLIGEDRKGLVADVEKSGDTARGELIYRRKTVACTVCHGIGPVGPAIGPNLVAVGAGANTEYIVEAILEPNKSIAEHYENVQITTKNGDARMGVITLKTETHIVMRDSTVPGKTFKIPMASIKSTRPMQSLMPTGLVDQLKSRQEFLDLARFVSVLGRPGAYANDESPVIRKWKVVSTNGSKSPPKIDADWTTIYSLVNGQLPMADIGTGNVVYARGAIDVKIAGSIKLLYNPAGLRLWLNGKPVADLNATLNLGKGRHTVTFEFDRTKRGDKGLRVELTAPTGSSAKYQPEGGV